jgi:hypothetical protein
MQFVTKMDRRNISAHPQLSGRAVRQVRYAATDDCGGGGYRYQPDFRHGDRAKIGPDVGPSTPSLGTECRMHLDLLAVRQYDTLLSAKLSF